jgi:hypothetical protein
VTARVLTIRSARRRACKLFHRLSFIGVQAAARL